MDLIKKIEFEIGTENRMKLKRNKKKQKLHKRANGKWLINHEKKVDQMKTYDHETCINIYAGLKVFYSAAELFKSWRISYKTWQQFTTSTDEKPFPNFMGIIL